MKIELVPCRRFKFCRQKVNRYAKVEYCTRCQILLKKLREENSSLEYFLEKDVLFIFDHPNGCTAKELMSHMQICIATFNRHIRLGHIKVRETVKCGKEVTKYIDSKEMVRVIARAHNWVSVYKVAQHWQKQYYTLFNYVKAGYFDRWQNNLEGLLSIHVSVLFDFEDRWDRAVSSRNKSQRIRTKCLSEDEFCLADIAKAAKLLKYNVWQRLYRKGFLKGRTVKALVRISTEDLKDFLLRVAANECPVEFSDVELLLKIPRLKNDNVFLREIQKGRVEALPRVKRTRCQLKCSELCMTDLAEMAEVNVSVPQRWFNKGFVANSKRGRFRITTLGAVKKFILSALNGDSVVYTNDRIYAERMLRSERFKQLVAGHAKFKKEAGIET